MSGADSRPLYARLLRLQHLEPGQWTCYLLEMAPLAVAVVLALSDLVSAWVLLVLPLLVAGTVKSQDLLAGQLVTVAPIRASDRERQADGSADESIAYLRGGPAAAPASRRAPAATAHSERQLRPATDPVLDTAPAAGAQPSRAAADPAPERATAPVAKNPGVGAVTGARPAGSVRTRLLAGTVGRRDAAPPAAVPSRAPTRVSLPAGRRVVAPQVRRNEDG